MQIQMKENLFYWKNKMKFLWWLLLLDIFDFCKSEECFLHFFQILLRSLSLSLSLCEVDTNIQIFRETKIQWWNLKMDSDRKAYFEHMAMIIIYHYIYIIGCNLRKFFEVSVMLKSYWIRTVILIIGVYSVPLLINQRGLYLFSKIIKRISIYLCAKYSH